MNQNQLLQNQQPQGQKSNSHLFSPWCIQNLKLDNRIVIPPMCQYSAKNGVASDWHLIHYGQLSHSGAGLLIFEATAVAPEGRISWADLGLYNDECEEALKKKVNKIKQFSLMPLAIQLAHAGRKASTDVPWLTHQHLASTTDKGWKTVAPSAEPYNDSDEVPLELEITNLMKIKNQFVDSAERALRCGFHGIEIHMAHGYLLHEFLSPISNQRTDEYGGSLQNRMRYPLEVFEAVYHKINQQIPVWVRISATDWMENGLTLSEIIEFCQELKKRGCELIHVSSGGLDKNQLIDIKPLYQVKFAEEIKKQVQIQTIAVGLITEPEQAEQVIANQQADAVAIGRQILFNPHWPWFAAQILKAKVKIPPQYLRSHQQANLFLEKYNQI